MLSSPPPARPPRLARGLLVAAALLAFLPPAPGADEKPLVVANLNAKQDAQGCNWDVTPNGTVGDGTSDCFDNGMVLQVNGNNGNFQRPMMTADGTELVLSGKFNNNVTVKRQIRLDAPRAVLRYVETVENAGPQAQQVRLSIVSTLGSNCSGVVSSAGTGYAGSLGKEDVGILAVQQAGQQRPSVLWLVADRRSKLKPTITVQDNRNFQVVYTLDLPPKTPVTILHYVAQRRNATAANAPQLFADLYKKGRLLDPQLPKALRKLTVNFKTGGGGATAEDDAAAKSVLQPVQDLLDRAGVKRDKADLLAFGDAGKITGNVTGDDLQVETAYGEASIPLASVAAINGGAGQQKPVQVYLRSGEILTGTVKADNLVLTTEAGWKTEIKPEAINLLAMHVDAAADGVETPWSAGLLQTAAGDRLALAAGQNIALEAATPWGVLQAPLDQIDRLVSVREPYPSQRITLRNHTQVFGLLRGGELALATLRFGMVKVLPPTIREYRPSAVVKKAAVSEDEDADDAAEDLAPGAKEESLCQLTGENILAGTIDLPALHLTTKAGTVPLDTKTLRSLQRSDQAKENEPLFVAKLVSGDEITGLLEERTVPVRSGEKVWRVPASHLVNASNPPLPPTPDKPADAPAPAPSPSPEPKP